jgi:predicted membrane channel-forming protein YqfA (hemolysin III family)
MNTPKIVKKADAEPWMVNNKHILSGYRVGYDTKWKAFLSLFQVHNETANVWSHLIGTLLFVYYLFYVFRYMSMPAPIFLKECPSDEQCAVQ